MSNSVQGRRVRSLFLSDLHLGARASRPGRVLDFLRAFEAETIYLVGDVLDLWHGGRVFWNARAEAVMDELAARARAGVRVVYLAGNHDAILREPGAARLPTGFELREAVIHAAADGRRYLVVHGDQADFRLLRSHALTRVGSRAEAALRNLDAMVARRRLPRVAGQRSHAERLIAAFNSLVVMADRFERKLTGLAAFAGADGVICGHSHKPLMREIDGVLYANCGDWVDSMTAIAEEPDGRLQLLAWRATGQKRPAARAIEVPAQP
ncbi:MAG: UDP-2,3-diacylglucosamine diphosphatase [Alphaproteobacteria bacterium]|nr:MAG: UDP-2,3-diacylglucosamine diphosphatase [Alphaproteobacteria bacterium]